LGTQIAEHVDVFTALDCAYGLIDGTASWPDCLAALIDISGVQATRLLLYDYGRGQSHIVDAAGVETDKGRLIHQVDIDEALWRSTPGDVWLSDRPEKPHPTGLLPFGYSVLDRDNAFILYLEFLISGSATERSAIARRYLQRVLPHLHRACRLHRSIAGHDLGAFTAPDLAQASTAVGIPIELRLRRRFRLSRAEARVATLLSDGLAPRMIADRLNVSIHTVRSQLQAIFSKTDTSRQAELTSLILRETEVPKAVYQRGPISIERSEQRPCP